MFQAVETLKSFEKKDTKVAATAATNLSFLYILVGCGHDLSSIPLRCITYESENLVWQCPVVFLNTCEWKIDCVSVCLANTAMSFRCHLV